MNKFSGVSGVRVAAETAIALFAGALGVVTIFWHDWIEALTGWAGWDPDRHNGSLEWVIVAVLLVTAAAVGATAWRGWRLLRAAAAQAR